MVYLTFYKKVNAPENKYLKKVPHAKHIQH